MPFLLKLLWWGVILSKASVVPRWVHERLGWRYICFVSFAGLTTLWSAWLATLSSADFRAWWAVAAPWSAAGMVAVIVEAAWLLVREFPSRPWKILLTIGGVAAAFAGVVWAVIRGPVVKEPARLIGDGIGGLTLFLGVTLALFLWGCQDGPVRRSLSLHAAVVAIWAGGNGLVGRIYAAGWIGGTEASVAQMLAVLVPCVAWTAWMRAELPVNRRTFTPAELAIAEEQLERLDSALKARAAGR